MHGGGTSYNTEQGHFFNAVVMDYAGANVFKAAIMDISDLSCVGVQLIWTGTPTGTFKIYISNSYNPSVANSQPDGTPLNAGTWTDITASAIPAITNPTANAGNDFITFFPICALYMKVEYEPNSSSAAGGLLDGFWMGMRT